MVAAIIRGLNRDRFAAAVACIGAPGPVGQELESQGYPVASLGLDIKTPPPGAWWRACGASSGNCGRTYCTPTFIIPIFTAAWPLWDWACPGWWPRFHNSYPRVKFHRRLWNFALGWMTDRVLVGSSQVWRDVRTFDAIPASRLVLLPYGIPLAELDCPETYAEARERLQVSGFVVGTVGRLEEQKGHADLLNAWPDLRREIPDLTLLIVGGGRRQEALQRRVGELGALGRVRFLGTRRDLPLIYRALDLYVQPSRWEGLPLALLKAMGAGLPAVATRVSGIEEVITDGVNGCLVAPGHPEALAQAILSLYRHPGTRARLGKEAMGTVRAHYSQEAMLARLEEIYLELWQQGRHEPQ